METLAYPLQVNTIRRNSKHNTFGMVRNNHHRAHQGWDLLATPLTPCYAIADGIIRYSRPYQKYGNMILLRFEFKHATYFAAYCHLSLPVVVEGQEVYRGQAVGLTGDSGNAKSMRGADHHLHFEIRTEEFPGHGLHGRVDPAKLYGNSPLWHTIHQRVEAGMAQITSRPGLRLQRDERG